MPCRNTIKNYRKNGFYHVYNRGVNAQQIFFDEQDCQFFMGLLNRYLFLPAGAGCTIRNYSTEIRIHAFCLMPTHIHFLLQQHHITSMSEFMRSIIVSYTHYINKKYMRVGHLFQGKYKARLIENIYDFFGVSDYIHRNPVESLNIQAADYTYSSFLSYVKPELRLWSFLERDVLTDYYRGSDPL